MASPIASLVSQWEYQSINGVAEGPLLDALNEAGREGWELVSAVHYRSSQGAAVWSTILKRPMGLQPASLSAASVAAASPVSREHTASAAATEEEEGEFDVNPQRSATSSPAARPKAPRAAPPRPRMELSDEFDFELASTMPGGPQATKQVKKGKAAAEDEEFDFEVGESFSPAAQAAKPQPPKSAPPGDPDDDTGFDLG
jgi:hypothetical protein